jgi:hypothetical protein
MSVFGRPFKPPLYLGLGRRPSMPGRALSNSSDLSVGSPSPKSEHTSVVPSAWNYPTGDISPGTVLRDLGDEDSILMMMAEESQSPRGNNSFP